MKLLLRGVCTSLAVVGCLASVPAQSTAPPGAMRCGYTEWNEDDSAGKA
jgi:hypothetical protein